MKDNNSQNALAVLPLEATPTRLWQSTVVGV